MRSVALAALGARCVLDRLIKRSRASDSGFWASDVWALWTEFLAGNGSFLKRGAARRGVAQLMRGGFCFSSEISEMSRYRGEVSRTVAMRILLVACLSSSAYAFYSGISVRMLHSMQVIIMCMI